MGGSMRRQPVADVQVPLMLVMPVKAGKVPELKAALTLLGKPPYSSALEAKLDKVGTVHSTRFVVLEDDPARLIVLALYDGSVEDYIGAFARELNREFNVLFGFIEDTEDKPVVPVENDVERFVQYVVNRDVKPANGQTYSAYPGLTALDLYEATRPTNDGAPAR
jgi:hypothetical protein